MSVFPRLVGCALVIAGWLPLRGEQADATPARDLSYFELKDVTLLDGPFRHAQQLGADYVLALEPDRLLAGFRLEAGLEPKVKKYPNWESSGLDGHTLGHYLTALAQLWAATGDVEMKRRLDYCVAELAACQAANGNGYVGAVPDSRKLWAGIAAGGFTAQGFSLGGAWVPWYNVHKTFAGLRDAWLIGGNAQAREVLAALGDWCGKLLDGLADEDVRVMLRAEYGGMNEVLADLAAVTGEPRYLAWAQRFSDRELLDTLLRREDTLTGKHANTQIPKVVGYERVAELGGDPAWSDAAAFFWKTVVERRSVAFGGNSVREHFNAPDDFASMLQSREGPESCNTHNMLRLTEALFRHEGAAGYADYYERALYNHILSTQHPEHGGYVYFTPIRPRHYRVYSQPQQCFWCCVGTGIENHGKYGRFIYAADRDGGLWINLFIASELRWTAAGLRLRQETKFPDESATSLTLSLSEPRTFPLHLRHPEWVGEGKFTVRINGKPAEVRSQPSSYAVIKREWRDGDRIQVDLPMRTRLERLPDDSNYAAVMHGPILLAAKIDTNDMPGLIAGDARMGHVAPGAFEPLDAAPMLVGDPATMAAHFSPVPGKPLHFTAQGLIRPSPYASLELEPFFRVHDARYMMYWRVATPGEYDQVVRDLQASEAARLALDRRTVDLVIPGEQQPEVEHRFAGGDSFTGHEFGRSWRTANDWFGYELNPRGEKNLTLQLTHWGNAWRPEDFTVEINGSVIGTVPVSGKQGENFIVYSLAVPADADVLRVVFRPAPGSPRVPPLYEIRLVRAAQN
jgi:DUF1680 family protein